MKFGKHAISSAVFISGIVLDLTVHGTIHVPQVTFDNERMNTFNMRKILEDTNFLKGVLGCIYSKSKSGTLQTLTHISIVLPLIYNDHSEKQQHLV